MTRIQDRSILLVEEGMTNRHDIEETLQAEGYRLLQASSCDDALQILEGEVVDLILIDPEIDNRGGYALCRDVRNTEAIAQLPIIMLTPAEMRDNYAEGYESGVDDFIETPIIRDVLLARVRTITRLCHYRTLNQANELMTQQADELDRLRKYDPVTGLANFNTFNESLHHEIQRASRSDYAVAVIAVTVNEFDQIQGAYGQDMANALACRVGDRLSNVSRSRAVVARVDASTFIIHKPIPDIDNLVSAIQQFRQRFNSPVVIGEEELNVTCSAGACSFPNDADSAEDLVTQALSATVRAKQQGRNRYQVYSKVTQSEVKRQLRLESQIRRGLESKGLKLHYQPRFDVVEGKVTAVEGLMRMQDENGAYIPPNVFLPVARDSGQLYEMGRRVIRQACVDVAELVRQGHTHMRVSMNLSGEELRHPTFVDDLEDALMSASLTGRHLQLEVNESTLVPGEDYTLQQITQRLIAVRLLGVQIIIDNFGTGYSSLRYMRHLPIDGLKIDPSFIRDANDDPRAAAIARSIINVAENLDISVIADGVETVEQLRFLRDSGCTAVQGYIFSKAQPFSELPATLGRLHRDWNDPFSETGTFAAPSEFANSY